MVMQPPIFPEEDGHPTTSGRRRPVFTPSDPDLDRSYVALEPGNYKPREDLTPYKYPNLTEQELERYRPESPLGVGSLTSCVHVYPQGTIEIYGHVYCWNKLVKPGIYSRFEKLRYLNTNETIQPRNTHDQFSHHAVYNRITIPSNDYVVKRTTEQESILEYRYVDFLDQIWTEHNGNVYPVPIINGKLTIYPDGTFLTEGIVIKSDDACTVDEYGYIGDQPNYGKMKTWFNEVTLDPVDPRRVYKLISQNPDGSVTYGAIAENKSLTSTDWIRLPRGIIPINDGKVTINPIGQIQIDGTVITAKGRRIYPGIYLLNDIFMDNVGKSNSVENPKAVDLSAVWNPTLPASFMGVDKSDTVARRKRKILGVVDENTTIDVYQYHYESGRYQIEFIEEAHGYVSTFLPMKGWDVFTSYEITNKPVDDILDLSQLNKLFGRRPMSFNPVTNAYSANGVDTRVYPYVSEQKIVIGNKYRYPRLRFNPSGVLASYATVDHTLYEDFSDLTLQENNRALQQVIYREENGYPDVIFQYKAKQPTYETYATLSNDTYSLGVFDDPNIPKFIPFSSFKYRTDDPELHSDPLDPETDVYNNYQYTYKEFHGQIVFKRVGNKIKLNVSKNVILKMRGMYFTLRAGEVDITNGLFPEGLDELFTGNVYNGLGYIDFKHPMFVDKTTNKPSYLLFNNSHRYDDALTYLGEQYGVYSLLERNITAYLTSYEQQLIDNTRMPVRTYERVRMTTKGHPVIDVKEMCGFYYDMPFTALDTRIGLSYYSRRFNEYIPTYFNAILATTDTRIPPESITYMDLNRVVYFERDQEYLNVVNPFHFKLHTFSYNNAEMPFSLSLYRGKHTRDTFNQVIDINTPYNQITNGYREGVLTLGNYSLDPLSQYTANLGYRKSEMAITYFGLPHMPLSNKRVAYMELFKCPTRYIALEDKPDLSQYNEENPLPEEYQNYSIDENPNISKQVILTGYYGHQIHYRCIDELSYMTDTVYMDNDHPKGEDTETLSPNDHQLNQRDNKTHIAWLDRQRFNHIKQKYGYIDFWLDNPFNEQISTHRVYTRKNWTMEPVKLISPDYPTEIITTDVHDISAQGEPNARYALVDLGDRPDRYLDPATYNINHPDDNYVKGGRLNELGLLRMKDIDLKQNHRYALITIDDFGVRRWTIFDVTGKHYREGDFITPEQLFGRNEYFWPVNLRNTDNKNTDLNLVDSTLSFDLSDTKHQTYTITGIMRSEAGNIYREGTYVIGHTPPMYQSALLRNVEQHLDPLATKGGTSGYIATKTVHRAPAKNTIRSRTTAAPINSQALVNEWWIVDAWKRTIPTTPNNTKNGEQVTQEMARILANSIFDTSPSTRLRELNEWVYVGRYQDKIVFDGLAYFENLGEFYLLNPAIPELNGVITPGEKTYHPIEKTGLRYRREGYTFEQFHQALSLSLPWWVNPDVQIENVYRPLPWKQVLPMERNASAICPVESKVVSFAKMSDVYVYQLDGKKLKTQEQLPAYQLTGYNIYTWTLDQLKDRSLTGKLYCIGFTMNYAYNLTDNYDKMPVKMDEDVRRYWTERGFPPEMFVFDDDIKQRVMSHGGHHPWVEYHEDGIHVTIHGTVRIGGRITWGSDQRVTDKSQIRFSPFCRNMFIPHNSEATLYWNDGYDIELKGIWYYRAHNLNTCEPLDYKYTDWGDEATFKILGFKVLKSTDNDYIVLDVLDKGTLLHDGKLISSQVEIINQSFPIGYVFDDENRINLHVKRMLTDVVPTQGPLVKDPTRCTATIVEHSDLGTRYHLAVPFTTARTTHYSETEFIDVSKVSCPTVKMPPRDNGSAKRKFMSFRALVCVVEKARQDNHPNVPIPLDRIVGINIDYTS